MSKSINNSTVIRPYTNKQLLKWTTMMPTKHEPVDWKDKQLYDLKSISLVELVKQPEYVSFKTKFSWLYMNYTHDNYDLVWNELQERHERVKQNVIYHALLSKIEKVLAKNINDAVAKFRYVPQACTAKSEDERVRLEKQDALFAKFQTTIDRLNDDKRAVWLRYARVCFDLIPEELDVVTKDYYTLAKTSIKDYTDWGNPIYYTEKEMDCLVEHISVFGKSTIKLAVRAAEDAVIRQCMWMKQFNGTENDLRVRRSIEGDSVEYEVRIAKAKEYVLKNKDSMTIPELVRTAVWLYDLYEEGVATNSTVPISDPYADDAEERYSVDEVFVDFLASLHSEDAE